MPLAVPVFVASRSADVETIREPGSDLSVGTSCAEVEELFVSVVPEASDGSVATGTVIVFVARAAMLVTVQVIVVWPRPGVLVCTDVSANPPVGAMLAAPGV